MAVAKRIFLFMALNFLIVVTISAVVSVLGLQPYLSGYGIDYPVLIAFSLIWGMGGALISLALSRVTAKWFMGVRLVDPHTQDPQEARLLQTVYRLAQAANINTMPQVGIYESPELNAFATGPMRSKALVAVSRGLLARMDSAKIEGVLGHEISHVANGDMVTMALLQGVVNAFVIFLSRIIAYAVAQVLRKGEHNEGISYGTYFVVSLVLQVVFLILGSLLVAFFSRYREYRADHGGANLAGRQNMINALRALQAQPPIRVEEHSVNNLKISGQGSGLFRLFATHPPLQKRIERLALTK